MMQRSMTAAAALAALAVSGCCHPPSRGGYVRASTGDLVRLTEVGFKDDEGHKLVVRFDEAGKPTAEGSKDGKPIDVREFPLKGSYICFGEPSSKTCTPIQFLSEGAVFKIGTATCTCGYYGTYYRCVGYPTCP